MCSLVRPRSTPVSDRSDVPLPGKWWRVVRCEGGHEIFVPRGKAVPARCPIAWCQQPVKEA
jgi:hypothetical protein